MVRKHHSKERMKKATSTSVHHKKEAENSTIQRFEWASGQAAKQLINYCGSKNAQRVAQHADHLRVHLNR